LYVVFGALLVGSAVWAFRRRATRASARRPLRGKYPVRERQPGVVIVAARRGDEPARRVPADVPVAKSRATALADRRSIRWKESL
jgi:hypothetical protein